MGRYGLPLLPAVLLWCTRMKMYEGMIIYAVEKQLPCKSAHCKKHNELSTHTHAHTQ